MLSEHSSASQFTLKTDDSISVSGWYSYEQNDTIVVTGGYHYER